MQFTRTYTYARKHMPARKDSSTARTQALARVQAKVVSRHTRTCTSAFRCTHVSVYSYSSKCASAHIPRHLVCVNAFVLRSVLLEHTRSRQKYMHTGAGSGKAPAYCNVHIPYANTYPQHTHAYICMRMYHRERWYSQARRQTERACMCTLQTRMRGAHSAHVYVHVQRTGTLTTLVEARSRRRVHVHVYTHPRPHAYIDGNAHPRHTQLNPHVHNPNHTIVQSQKFHTHAPRRLPHPRLHLHLAYCLCERSTCIHACMREEHATRRLMSS